MNQNSNSAHHNHFRLPLDAPTRRIILERIGDLRSFLPAHKAVRYGAVILDRRSKFHFIIGMVNLANGVAQEDLAGILNVASRYLTFVSISQSDFEVLYAEIYQDSLNPGGTGTAVAPGAMGELQQSSAAKNQNARQTSVWRSSSKNGKSSNEDSSDIPLTDLKGVIDLTNNEQYARWKAKDAANEIGDLSIREFIIYTLMDFARWGASDLHLEIAAEYGTIRFRCDGVLYERFSRIPVDKAIRIVNGFTDIAGQDRTQLRHKPLKGIVRVSIPVKGQPTEVELRFNSVKSVPLPEVNLRYVPEKISKLAQTGLYRENLQIFDQAISQPQGIILTTGPTGSGKTQTQNGCLEEISDVPNPPKICEMGDPIEHYSPKRTQVVVSTPEEWAETLDSFLRHDPDVMVLGELRSPESVEAALHAALTGHLVFGTLHTVNVETTFTRLFLMNVEKDILADALNAIHSQRLVRVLCSCKEVDIENSRKYNRRIYQRTGCHLCYGTGFVGRTAIGETILVTDEMRAWIRDGKSPAWIVAESARRGWLYPFSLLAGRKVAQGVTDLKEIKQVIKIDFNDGYFLREVLNGQSVGSGESENAAAPPPASQNGFGVKAGSLQ